MAEERSLEMKLPSLDEIFSSQEERDEESLKKIYEIDLMDIDPFPEHPFKVQDDEDMMNLAESVKANGILTPATVRKKEDGRYELLSGHRRFRACQIAGLNTLRSEIVDMSRDEATIFMVESNFQRTKILPSEKAFAYKMRLDAMNRHAGRPHKDNLTPVVSNNLRTNERLGKEVGESREQVRRYIRLTELIPELLEMVDAGEIAMRPAVELSYIPKLQQGQIWMRIDLEQCTPSHDQAIRMRRMADEDKLTPEVIEAIMTEEKPNQREKIILRGDRFKNLFPRDLPISKREEYIAKAMEYYARYIERQRDEAR